MENINGKVLVFTDLHIGLSGNKVSRLNIVISVIKNILAYIKNNDIKHCLFLGDWHHNRVSSENNMLNVSYKLMSAIAKLVPITVLIGNHDTYYKNSVDVNSLNIFKDTPNVEIISQTTECEINGKKALFVPWLGDMTKYSKSEFDYMFGHFDVCPKYLIKSYVEDHATKTSTTEILTDLIDSDTILKDMTSVVDVNEKNIDEAVHTTGTAGDYIGDFVELVKEGCQIYSGHIHGRREFLAHKRNFIFVGSPYQQNRGDVGMRRGFYVLNEDFTYDFHEISNVPKFVILKMSQILNTGIDKFDFSVVKNNIVSKIYDCEVDRILETKIIQKIIDFHPYEELIPEYQANISYGNDTIIANESIELIRKSKLDYIKNYISNIDKAVLTENEIDPDKLFDVLQNYYIKVTDEKKIV